MLRWIRSAIRSLRSISGAQNLKHRSIRTAGRVQNPRNPYPHEIWFDQHVWLPRANERYASIDGAMTDRKTIQGLIEDTFPEVKHVSGTHPDHVEQKLVNRLTEREISAIDAKLGTLNLPVTRYNQIRIATHFFPDTAQKLGLSPTNPPDHIHRLQRGEWYVGDIYSANMIIDTVGRRGFAFSPGSNYLDFGCSSGSFDSRSEDVRD